MAGKSEERSAGKGRPEGAMSVSEPALAEAERRLPFPLKGRKQK